MYSLSDFQYCQNDFVKRRHLWDCIALYLDSVEEIFTSSKELRLSEIRLLSGKSLIFYKLSYCEYVWLRTHKIASFYHNTYFDVSVCIFIGKGLSYLMPACKENELRKVFLFLMNILSTVR